MISTQRIEVKNQTSRRVIEFLPSDKKAWVFRIGEHFLLDSVGR